MSSNGLHGKAFNLDSDLFKFTDFVSKQTSPPSLLGYFNDSKISGDSLGPQSANISAGEAIGNVAAAAHFAALFNRSSFTSYTEIPSTLGRKMETASCYSCRSKSPVASFHISQTASNTTFSRKRKAQDQNIDIDTTCSRRVTTGVRSPPKVSRQIKRQKLVEVQRKILSVYISPCEKLRSMAQDLRSGVISKQQAKLITRYVIKEAKRTEDEWRRDGVDCSPNELVSICREEPGLEWMFD